MSKTPKTVSAIEPNENYEVTVVFRSTGEDNQVSPDISYSHKFVDEYDGDYPASYLLARDVLMMLNVMMTMQQQSEDEDDEDGMSLDELALAAEAARSDDEPTVH